MADDKADVQQTRAYGAERYMLRQIPLAAFLLAIGLGLLIWPVAKPGSTLFAFALSAGSFAYIAFACFRAFEPGRPRLELSPDGIRQRLSHGHILHIPWHEVQDVVSTDHTTTNVVGIVQTMRDVPAVVVSPAFYDRWMPQKPWLKRPLNWGHFALGKNDAVRVLFRPDYLGTRSEELRQAIETRWRAFSRHPNAKLPPSAESRKRQTSRWPWWLPSSARSAIFIAALFTGLYLIWVFVLASQELPDGVRSWYLDDLLDKGAVTARLADGRMARLGRGDVDTKDVPECKLEMTREPVLSWLPLWPATVTARSCTARLTLRTGAQATAVFRIVVEMQTVEQSLGKFSEQPMQIVAPLSLDEADALLCRLGHCGPDAQKR